MERSCCDLDQTASAGVLVKVWRNFSRIADTVCIEHEVHSSLHSIGP